MKAMPTNQPAGKPIFDRSAHAASKPVSNDEKTLSLDAQAEQIRKSWLQRFIARSK
jgi:hypothetical protein